MSAGSKTEPGGYYKEQKHLEQFQVADERNPQEIKRVVEEKGYEPVWKNWDEALQKIT